MHFDHVPAGDHVPGGGLLGAPCRGGDEGPGCRPGRCLRVPWLGSPWACGRHGGGAWGVCERDMPYRGGSLRIPRAFRRLRILPTIDVDTDQPRRLRSTTSLSLPHSGEPLPELQHGLGQLGRPGGAAPAFGPAALVLQSGGALVVPLCSDSPPISGVPAVEFSTYFNIFVPTILSDRTLRNAKRAALLSIDGILSVSKLRCRLRRREAAGGRNLQTRRLRNSSVAMWTSLSV